MSIRFCSVFPADDSQLNAQVPATIPHCQGQRHPQVAMESIQDICLQRDRVHRRHSLPERKGKNMFHDELAPKLHELPDHFVLYTPSLVIRDLPLTRDD